MAEQIPDPAHDADEGHGPPVPWIDPRMQQQVGWRNGDIVISVPVKSGTTWTMNIVHQLRSGGDPDMEDVYAEVPWLELLAGPTVEPDEVVRQIDAMPAEPRRAFKTHSGPGALPYHAPGSGVDVRYVVVMRHPDEVLASMYPFISRHSREWFALWGIDKDEFVPPDFPAFVDGLGMDLVGGSVFSFAAAWWPLRNEPNVLMMHFSDMKRDHEGSVRQISDFLGFEPDPEQWARVIEYTSFPWMKQHGEKFEIRTLTEVPILESGAMVRKGRVGAAREDGVTEEMSARLAAMGQQIVGDEEALAWIYR